MLISQLTESSIIVRPFGGWGQVGGVVVEADNEDEVENELEEVEVEVEVKFEEIVNTSSNSSWRSKQKLEFRH